MKIDELKDMYEYVDVPFTKDGLDKVPQCSANYVIHDDKMCQLIKEETTIKYIGKADDNVQKRLREYLNPGPSQETNKKINAYLRIKAIGKKRILIMPVDTKAEARRFEKELIATHRSDHMCAPLLNG